jgi:FixJ family two-component response regulator
MTSAKAMVHVVDDDASWRTSIQRLMSAAGYDVALHENAEHFLETAKVDAPGCVLLDVRMPGLTGLQLQERLTAMRQSFTIVFVSGHGDISTSVLAMRAGAEDFLTKPVETSELLRAVERAIERDGVQRERRAKLDTFRARLATLTPSERNVFDRVVRGRLNKQIAAELGSTERTIKWHRHNLMQKLKLESVAELVVMAERLGLTGPHESSRSE